VFAVFGFGVQALACTESVQPLNSEPAPAMTQNFAIV